MTLFMVPFLTWFNYGPNLMFHSQMSLIYLYERGFEFIPTLYIIGVAATIISTAVARRPVFFQGLLPAAFPLFILTTLTAQSLFLGYAGYALALTPGIFMALVGSTLLQGSYFFSYRK